jgi:hypothetical protein
MAIELGLGRFGDRRLEKGGSPCMRPLSSGLARVSGGLQDDGRRKCGSRAFCGITL